MTVVLAYASPPEIGIVLALVAVAFALLAVALRPPRHHEPARRHELPPRPVEPRSNVRTVEPRPAFFDWSVEDSDRR